MKISNPGSCTCQESPRLLSYILAIHRQGKNSLFSLVWPWIRCPAQTALNSRFSCFWVLQCTPVTKPRRTFCLVWFYVHVFLCVWGFCPHICVPHTCVVMPKVRRGHLTPGTKVTLSMVESHSVATGNQTRLLWKSSECRKRFLFVGLLWPPVSETVRSERLAIPGPPPSPHLQEESVSHLLSLSLIFSVSFQVLVYMFPISKEK